MSTILLPLLCGIGRTAGERPLVPQDFSNLKVIAEPTASPLDAHYRVMREQALLAEVSLSGLRTHCRPFEQEILCIKRLHEPKETLRLSFHRTAAEIMRHRGDPDCLQHITVPTQLLAGDFLVIAAALNWEEGAHDPRFVELPPRWPTLLTPGPKREAVLSLYECVL